MERSVLRGLAVFRWAAWAWMAIVLLLGREHLRDGREWMAVTLVGLALAVTIVDTVLLRTDPNALLRGAVVGVAWPLFGVLSAGLAFGPLAGAVAGTVAAGVPTWAWLAAGGSVLLAAGVAMERKDTSPVEAGRRVVDLIQERFD